MLSDLHDVPDCDVVNNEYVRVKEYLDTVYHTVFDTVYHTVCRPGPSQPRHQKQEQKQKKETPYSPPLDNGPDMSKDNVDKSDKDKKSKSKDKSEHPRFAEFWDAYPPGRKTKRARASESFTKAVAEGTDPEVLIDAAAEYARSDEGQGDYVKMPSTWLNGQCWLDDRQAWKAKGDEGTAARATTSEESDPSFTPPIY